MKRCPRCSQTYTDDELNFCLNDGEFLTSFDVDPPPTIFGGETPPIADDAPPTVLLNKPRITNQTNWQPGGPMAQWQGQTPGMANQPYIAPAFQRSVDQTLPIVALVLGISALALVCCYGGLWLGLPAAAVGYFGMRNADNDPARYGGRGLAIGGMVLGAVTAVLSIIHIIIIIFSLLAS